MNDAAVRLEQQFAFLLEIDRLKLVLRASELIDNSRYENSAEHSWHICLYAMVLAEQADATVNINRVIKMLLLHDIVEIDAGDHPIHEAFDAEQVALEEAAAATRLFGMLPADQERDFRAIWDEFEAAETPDAVFAKSLDRVAPVFQNIACGGGSWAAYDVTEAQIDSRVGVKVARGAPKLWDFVKQRVTAHFSGQAPQ